ncbi:hypothetical protein D2E51_17945 [Mycobacteroides abscessus]|mgnify:CR=1 FL=1|uniref:Uncharacterized protein n=1 Tax=Mycobacteroides abscessus TaxID=36809 RepID=A0AB33T862_9MYCO|nr:MULTISPECIES: hypothetical protein [Mycobacteroides]RIS93731.1 hypothetical protein D2E51_17945 [Mycobacteroides abscessus]CPT66758.1 Uncharacterised protein [Mycobacteroides abscessus]CPT77178.1 Uncharacterised protein [Mycobacteroides abscessus]CPV17644.1 Uncharacterised protein [Mycobacteroides abscessus]CPW64433.1 Uncharacterised protein [Mycobacteroides abscessus]
MSKTVDIRTGTYTTSGGITFNVSDTDLGDCGVTDCNEPAMVDMDLDGAGGKRCPTHYQPWAENPTET